MSKRALVKVLAAPEDLEDLRGVLDHLRSSGVRISEANGNLGKKDIVLAVLSRRLYSNEDLKEKLFDQLAVGAETILPLNLEETPVPEEIMNLLFARNIIASSGRTQEQLAQRILSAIPEKKNPVPGVLIAAMAVLFLLGGLFLWRSDAGQEEPAPVEEPIPNPLGITEEQLAEIKDVVIIGDYFGYYTYEEYSKIGHWPEIRDYAYEVVDGMDSHWYSNQDGHEFTLTRYEDLRFLEQMPNLNMLRMVLVDVDADMLPDLSGAERLTSVSIHNCSMEDISWLSGSPVSYLDIYDTNIADYGPLSECRFLSDVIIDGRDRYHGDLSNFAPASLVDLRLYNMNAGEELAALSGCRKMAYLTLEGLQLQNLDFVKDMPSLQRLYLGRLSRLQDISGVEKLEKLVDLDIWQCDQVRDYMPIHGCQSLERLRIDRWNWTYADSAFLNGLSKLRDIGLFGLNLNNMEFLATVNHKYGVSLGFCGDIQDYSGLAHVKHYNWIHVNPRSTGSRFGDFSLVAPHLKNASIGEMELYNCTNVDLSEITNVHSKLIINKGDLQDLTGLKAATLQQLELRDMQYLRSLKGIDGMTKLEMGNVELSILGCIRLLDYSALDGISLRALNLCGMYSLPDFSRFSLKSLRLESIEDLEDLSCLETLDKAGMYHLELLGLEDLKDLRVLRNYKGNSLYVPPQVADQAAELVADGNFHYYEVRYPESGWSPMNEEVTLLSMEELETLPKAILRRVSRVWIAGDQIVDPNRYEVQEEWRGNRPVAVLHDHSTGKTSSIKAGSIQDFSQLADLTNLRELRLYVQPITSLEGIQNMSNLACFEAMDCRDLRDVSAVYTLQNLDYLSLRNVPVDSIQGAQNLPRLRHLEISHTMVADLSPLRECDFSGSDGMALVLYATDIQDLSPIASVSSFGHLNVCGYSPETWMQYVTDTPIRGYCGPMGDDETLRQFVQQHPELEEMHIERGYELTDLTPLLELENLRYVHIWDRAERAGRSLRNANVRFQLDVD